MTSSSDPCCSLIDACCSISSLIYQGRQQAANVLGLPSTLYRPTSASYPLSNQVGAFNVAFNTDLGKYLKPSLYGQPVWYADFNGALAKPGDYIVRNDGQIWFVASLPYLLPIVAVSCNRSVNITRAARDEGLGAVGYSELTHDYILGGNETRWPCSILLGGRALSNDSKLAGSVKDGGWRILLPPSVPLTLEEGDTLFDDIGNRYTAETTELTDLGWRITANESHL